MNIIMAQLNFTVGDIEGNKQKILDAYRLNQNENALIIFSELALTGYYPQDLVNRQVVLARQQKAIADLVDATRGKNCAMIVGYVANNPKAYGKGLYNALALLSDGRQVYEYHKQLLPTYNVFDEARHFNPGDANGLVEFKGHRIGFLICEDAWAQTTQYQYAYDPVKTLKKQQPDWVVCINASPNNLGKQRERLNVIGQVAVRLEAPVIYVNQIGGNDELVFDGASFAVRADGVLAIQMPAFEEKIDRFNIKSLLPGKSKLSAIPLNLDDVELIWRQTVLGIRDYVGKCGFTRVVIGSSGGIDSAITLAICVQALGNENVTAITMPSKYSSSGSVDDSESLCHNLNIKLLKTSILEEFEIACANFETMTGEVPSKLTQENMQARIRGRILMEYSNHYGALVVSTGNKSEMSVGYATLYGDMNGGINPLGDLYKMEVYALARYINSRTAKEIVPLAIIDKAPSAELSADQKDSDSLPDYPLLDAILKLYVEGDLLEAEEKQRCHSVLSDYEVSEQEINRIHRLVDRAEFKRRQAPPIIRVQKRSFGMGRWLPVAAKY